MKVKTKLLLGVGALFLMIVALTVIGSYYINKSKTDTRNILAANYNSLLYSKNMMLALDNFSSGDAEDLFRKNLALEGRNITEKGEAEAWKSLNQKFAKFTQTHAATDAAAIRNDIAEVMRLNMEAIQRKSDTAIATSENAYFWIIGLGTFCFLVASSLLFNIPHSIASPIATLTESIEEISKRNYAERINLPMGGEFGRLSHAFNIMAQKLEEYESSNLQRQIINKKRVEALIENMHDPVVGLDEGGHIVFINDEALKVTGLVKADALGKAATHIAVDNDLVREILQREKARNPESMKIYADSKESYFDLEVVPISISKTGENAALDAGKVLILRNITRYKELEYAKTNFIATISHELKTPISAIKMGAQLLRNEKFGTLNEQQKELLNGIEDDGRRLLNITAELLNMAQVESGSMTIKTAPCSVDALLAAAYEANRMLAADKEIALRTDNAAAGETLTADCDKVVWILNNFISNALKNSAQGSEVVLGAVRRGAGVRLYVRDRGVGIPEEYRHRIFEKYFQVPGNPPGGTGLGLAIAKSFVERMGGSIGVESAPGEGSTFWLEIG